MKRLLLTAATLLLGSPALAQGYYYGNQAGLPIIPPTPYAPMPIAAPLPWAPTAPAPCINFAPLSGPTPAPTYYPGAYPVGFQRF